MRWTVHGERSLYESEWVSLRLVDVEIPDGERFDHHVIRMPNQAAGAVIGSPDRGVLMLWRHRFITDTWGWEIPAGRIDAGEDALDAAGREVLEETGWRPSRLSAMFSYQPTNGVSDMVFHLFAAEDATLEGPPSDPAESERVEWVPVSDLRRYITEGLVGDGLSLTALLWALVFGPLAPNTGGA
jgi:8-oxo-dGTP pyrophosphatase MutT (NUDIX family)